MTTDFKLIEANLLAVLAEVRQQEHVGRDFPLELLSFSGHVEQIREWIEDAGGIRDRVRIAGCNVGGLFIPDVESRGCEASGGVAAHGVQD
jgi:hypothetical protein